MFESLTERLNQVFQQLRGQGYLTEADVRSGLRQIRLALLGADVHYQAVRELLAQVEAEATGKRVLESLSPGQQLIAVVRESMIRLMGGERKPLQLSGRPAVVLLVGPAGGGKTTTAGKLARHLSHRGKKTLLLCADPYRPAATEQLCATAEKVGVDFASASDEPVREAQEVIQGTQRTLHDVVVVDTPGVPPGETPEPLLGELVQAMNASDVLLVLDALVGQEAAGIAEEFLPLGVTGVVLSKLDGDARGGAALSLPMRTQRPIVFVGTGERPEDLEAFHPERMTDRILGLGDLQGLAEQLEQAGVKQVEQSRVRQGSLTLDDFLEQLEAMNNAGPVSQFLSRIPGVKQQEVDDPELESELKRARAVIQSMTLEERRKPNIIGASRKRRIARGSGTTVQEVNRLLSQYEQARRMARTFGRQRTPPGPGNLSSR
ncbi:MAG: signal recognition particle receptor subunit alpha [Candidatus Bipolaricaulota bacterium]